MGVLLLLVLFSSGLQGCMSAYKKALGRQPTSVNSEVYLTDFNIAWQATLDALKSRRLDVTNRETGFIQTKWEENTDQRQFIDSFGGAETFLKSQARYRVSVAPGFHDGRESVKIGIQKDQLVKRDVLEGWVPVETDSVEENTILYRIGRLIYLKTRLAEIEKQRIQEETENLEF